MSVKSEAQEKTARQIQSSPKMIPIEELKCYGPLIQEFGLIVRNHGRNSDAEKEFLAQNPDFNEYLQLVSVLEHLRGAYFNNPPPKKPETSITPPTIVETTGAP